LVERLSYRRQRRLNICTAFSSVYYVPRRIDMCGSVSHRRLRLLVFCMSLLLRLKLLAVGRKLILAHAVKQSHSTLLFHSSLLRERLIATEDLSLQHSCRSLPVQTSLAFEHH
jgi:hypothetical protein